MIGIIWTVITSRFGGWIVGGLAVAAVLVVLKWEHTAKLKAQAAKETAQQGLKIGYEGYVKLYQEREKIKAQADQQRRKLNELQQAGDLDGLADTYNNPGGVRRPVQPNPQGGVKAPARYRDADGTDAEYQEAP
jgi:hypothetical protein